MLQKNKVVKLGWLVGWSQIIFSILKMFETKSQKQIKIKMKKNPNGIEKSINKIVKYS